jgi:hypothetical protein
MFDFLNYLIYVLNIKQRAYLSIEWHYKGLLNGGTLLYHLVTDLTSRLLLISLLHTFINNSLCNIFIYLTVLFEGLFKYSLSLKLASSLPLTLEILTFFSSGFFITALKIL